MRPDEARDLLQAAEDDPRWVADYGPLALSALAADTLEYGVSRPDDEGWGIWWDDQRMQDWGTLDETREHLDKVQRHCPDVRLVCRRVSSPWEVTDE